MTLPAGLALTIYLTSPSGISWPLLVFPFRWGAWHFKAPSDFGGVRIIVQIVHRGHDINCPPSDIVDSVDDLVRVWIAKQMGYLTEEQFAVKTAVMAGVAKQEVELGLEKHLAAIQMMLGLVKTRLHSEPSPSPPYSLRLNKCVHKRILLNPNSTLGGWRVLLRT